MVIDAVTFHRESKPGLDVDYMMFKFKSGRDIKQTGRLLDMMQSKQVKDSKSER